MSKQNAQEPVQPNAQQPNAHQPSTFTIVPGATIIINGLLPPGTTVSIIGGPQIANLPTGTFTATATGLDPIQNVPVTGDNPDDTGE